uniref:Uncharacterized protein n=1 Tax=Maylandia zebra TaxID=106582 RepID=A0A3P9DLA1_9CICH
MIQSSQPRSLKFTCRGFLLHLDFDFLPCRFPWRVLDAAVLRLLLALVPGPLSLGLFSRPSKALPSLLSLKSVCFFIDLVKTTKMRVETSNRYCCLLRGESGRSSVESIKTAGSDRNPSSALVLSLSRSLSCGRGGPELDSASAPLCSKWLLRKVRTAQRDRRRAV